MNSTMRDLIATMRTLHDRLASVVVDLAPDQLRSRSYATDWSLADVLSHLGSGAELSLLRLRAGPGDEPTYEETAQVWSVWDARTPEQQAVEAVAADERYVAALESLDDGAVATLHRELPGLELGAPDVVRLRISELAMHGWDVAVMLDEAAGVAVPAVPVLLDTLPVTLRFAAQPHDDVLLVRIETTEPEHAFLLELRQGETRIAEIADGQDEPQVDGELTLPAEALLRLVYGRLDPRHTPPLKASDPALLDQLRDIFRGF